MANTNRRRILSFVLALVLAFSLLPISVLADASAVTEQTSQQIVTAGAAKYYLADGTAGSSGSYDAMVQKTVSATGTENLFDVTVNVQFKNTVEVSHPGDAAVVLVLDTSGSMDDCAICGKSEGNTAHSDHTTYTGRRTCDKKPGSYWVDETGGGRNGNRPDGICDNCGYDWWDHTAETVVTPKDHAFQSRISAAKAALVTFLNAYGQDGTNTDGTPRALAAGTKRMVSLVTFAGYAKSWDLDPSTTGTKEYWINAADDTQREAAIALINSDDIDANGGTNTQAGMQLAENLLTNAGANAAIAGIDNQCVVLLTDGIPTFRCDTNSTTSGIDKVPSDTGETTNEEAHNGITRGTEDNAGSSANRYETGAVETVCHNLVNTDGAKLFGITYGVTDNIPNGAGTSVAINTWLASRGTNGCMMSTVNTDGTTTSNVYPVSNPTALQSAFSSILTSTTQSGTSSTAVTDAMVAADAAAADKVIGFVDFTGASKTASGLATPPVAYNTATGAVTWNLTDGTKVTDGVPSGFSGYQLTYQVYLDNTKTGTDDFVEGKQYSLSPASLTFTDASTSASHTVSSDSPAVKGYLGSLSFTKVAHENANKLSGAEFTLSNKAWVGAESPIRAAGSITRASTSDNNGLVSWNETIPSGFQYGLTETKAPDGYDANADVNYTVSVHYGQVTVTDADGNPVSLQGSQVQDTLTQTYTDLAITKAWQKPSDMDAAAITLTVQRRQAGTDDDWIDYGTITVTPNYTGEGDGRTLSSLTVNSTGVKSASAVLVASDPNSWTITANVEDNIPANGGSWTYQIAEGDVAGFSKSVSGLTVTNTATGTTSVSVEKHWVLPTGIAPEAVQVQLSRSVPGGNSESVGQPVTLAAADGADYSWTDLPLYSGQGQRYVYSVQEIIPQDATYRQTGDIANNGTATAPEYVITNTVKDSTTSAEIQKQWSDDSRTNADRPAVTVQLYRALGNGTPEPYGDPITLSYNTEGVVLSSDNNTWSYTVSNLPRYSFTTASNHAVTGVQEYTYTAREVNAPEGYNSQHEGLIIRNVRTGTIAELQAFKEWEDTFDTHAAVEFQLYQGGVAYGAPVSVDTDEQNSASWENLPQYDGNGAAYVYTVKEISCPRGYSTAYYAGETAQGTETGTFNPAENITAITVKNTLIPDDDAYTTVTVNKIWQAPAGTVHPDVTFTLYQSEENGEPVEFDSYVMPNGTETHTFGGEGTKQLPRSYAVTDEAGNVSYEAYGYTVSESAVESYNNGQVASGEQQGNIWTFTNTITGQVDVSVEKVWKDVNAESHPNAVITLSRYTNDISEQETVTSWTVDAPTHDFGKQEKYSATGELYTYVVSESSVTGYSSSISSDTDSTDSFAYTVTNTLDEIANSFAVSKVWVDGNKSNADRPSITVTLKQGTADYATVVLNGDGTYEVTPAAGAVTWQNGSYAKTDVEAGVSTTNGNQWYINFSNLPSFNADRTARLTYSVSEEKCAAYNEPVVNPSANSAAITNTLTQVSRDLTVNKYWVDGEREHPDVTFHLSATVNGTESTAYSKDVTLGYSEGATAPTNTDASATSGTWTYTWKDLPQYTDAGRDPIVYTVTETGVPAGYTSVDLSTGGSWAFRNTLDQDSVDVTVNKTLDQTYTGDYVKPGEVETIQVALYANGAFVKMEGNPATIELTKGENGIVSGKTTFANLDRYDAQRNAITYTVKEGSYGADNTWIAADSTINLGKDSLNNDAAYGVTYDKTKDANGDVTVAITNTYQQAAAYWYRIDTNYTTYVSGTMVANRSHSSIGTTQSFVNTSGTLNIDAGDYTTCPADNLTYQFVNGDVDGTALTAPAFTVSIDRQNHVYVITLNYVLNYYKLHVNYVFETGTKPASGYADYTDSHEFSAGNSYPTGTYVAPPAGYTCTPNADQTGTFPAGDVTLTYTYNRNVGQHADESASVTLNKYQADGSTLITGSPATFTAYSDAGCTNVVKTFTTGTAGTAAITAPADLAAGTYYLKESAAPTGYTVSEDVWQITVSVENKSDVIVDNAFVSYNVYSIALAKKAAGETAFSPVTGSAINVSDTEQSAGYTVKYYFETAPAAGTYVQKTGYLDLTGSLSYFDTTGVAASSFLLPYATAGYTLPTGYQFDHYKQGSSTTTTKDSWNVKFDSDDKVIELYYDLTSGKETTSVTGSKTWNGTVSTATIGLYRTVNGTASLVGTATVGVQTDSTTDNSYSFTNLPKWVGGQEASYQVHEVISDGKDGWTQVSDGTILTLGDKTYRVSDNNQGAIVNTELTDITINKTFTDIENGGIAYPGSVTVRLVKGAENIPVTVNAAGAALAEGINTNGAFTITKNSSGAYTATLRNLPAYDENGSAISYSVQEGATDEAGIATFQSTGALTLNGVDYTVGVTQVGSTFTVANTVKRGGIRVTKIFYGPADLSSDFAVKVWNGDALVTTLTQASPTFQKIGTGTKNDLYKYTWTVSNLLTHPTYSVTETGADVTGWTLASAPQIPISVKTGNTATLVNLYTRDMGYLTIVKNVSGLQRGESHTFTFQVTGADTNATAYSEEKSIAVTGSTGSVTFQVPTGSYAVTETGDTGISGYTLGTTTYATANSSDTTGAVTVDKTANATEATAAKVTVTNPYTYDTVPEEQKASVTVTKAWSDASNADGLRPVSIQVGLYSGDTQIDTKEIAVGSTGTDSVTFRYDSYLYAASTISVRELGYYTLDTAQGAAAATKTYHEGQVSGYTAAITGSAESGYTITNTHAPEQITIGVSKVWANGTSKQAVTLHLLANGAQAGTVTLDGTVDTAAEGQTLPVTAETSPWAASFGTFNKNAGGKAIAYTVTEDALGTYWSYAVTMTQTAQDTTAHYAFVVTNSYDEPDDDDDDNPPIVIPDKPTPGTDTPVVIPENPTPTTEIPATETPKAEAPKTGDMLAAWILAAAASGIGLVWLSITGKKRKDDSAQ